MEDSADSDYQPNVVLEVIQNGENGIEVRHNGEDNTTALLEAAAMAEQTIQEDGSIIYNVKLEPGLPMYDNLKKVVQANYTKLVSNQTKSKVANKQAQPTTQELNTPVNYDKLMLLKRDY